jgi:ADP-ribose pyrophosphatase YjhB (NUDIX family)
MGYIEELRTLVGTRPLVLIGVVVLVFDQHSRLLMVQSDEKWKLPGGFIELEESAEEAGMREIWEETGINLQSFLMEMNTFLLPLLTRQKTYVEER